MRIAYIGAGGFTSYFIHPQLALHGVELAALCDLDLAKAGTAQRKYGFRNVYSDYIAMLDNEKPDAVFCVGGPKVHYPVGMEVLERGYPLYVQKPPAPDVKSTREMADLARKKGVVCHVGFNMRFSPAILQAREIVKKPEFGRTLEGIFRYGLASTESMHFNVIDQHCHIFDLARYMMGDIRDIVVRRSKLEKARDYVIAVEFGSGAVGTINCTSGQLFEKEFIYFEVTGEQSFMYSHGGHELTWRRAMPHPWWRNPEPDFVYGHGAYGFQVDLSSFGYIGDIENFLAAVRGEAPDLGSIESTIGTMEVCEEVLRQMNHPD